MKTIQLNSSDWDFDFASAKRLSDAVATAHLEASNVCLSWFDAHTGQESPAHASDCHGSCEVPGYVDYAENRGAELKVVVGGGDFVFCYRTVSEFD